MCKFVFVIKTDLTGLGYNLQNWNVRSVVINMIRLWYSLTKVKTAFVHSLCYLNRPNTSKTHRSDDLFINAAIVQLN